MKMRMMPVMLLFGMLGWSASDVSAQYGLTAAPDLLPLAARPRSLTAPAAETPRIKPLPAASPATAPAPLSGLDGAALGPSGYSSSADATGGGSGPWNGTAVWQSSPAAAPRTTFVSGPSLPEADLALPVPQGEAASSSQADLPAENSSLMGMMLSEQAACGANAAESAGCQWLCDPACNRLWYARAAGLIMGRNQPNRVWFSYQSNNNANELMNGQDAQADWQGGWQVTIGRRDPCGTWALEGTYWGFTDMRGDDSVTHPDFVSTTLDFTDVVYANPAVPGLPADLFFGVYEQRLDRRNEVHNVEVNLFHYRPTLEDDPLRLDWLVGVRYFRFDESLRFSSRAHAGAWGDNPVEEGFLSDRAENNLIGAQLGFDMSWRVCPTVTLSCVPKFGIYNNHIHNRFDAYRGDGELFGPNPNPPVGDPVPGSFPAVSSKNTVAFLTEADIRLDWQFAPRWTAFVGYRVVAATGIALADHQFPFYVVDIQDAILAIDDNAGLILHGAFAGGEFRF
ncbi:BBP7 family outer membrane beta-barrel protein [Thermopirellula anaerolimosa]